MENHRLLPMVEYDEQVFNQIHKDTRALVKKLSFNIDYQRLNVSPDIVESWFDDKLIFVFNKYYGKMNNDVLKGHVINALQLFRNRILKSAYTQKSLFNQNFIDLGEDNELINIIPNEEEISDKDVLIKLMHTFIENQISKDAYYIYKIQMDPPPYILSKIPNRNSRISNQLMAEFCDLPLGNTTNNYLSSLRKEIKDAIKKAQNHFRALDNKLLLG